MISLSATAETNWMEPSWSEFHLMRSDDFGARAEVAAEVRPELNRGSAAGFIGVSNGVLKRSNLASYQ